MQDEEHMQRMRMPDVWKCCAAAPASLASTLSTILSLQSPDSHFIR